MKNRYSSNGQTSRVILSCPSRDKRGELLSSFALYRTKEDNKEIELGKKMLTNRLILLWIISQIKFSKPQSTNSKLFLTRKLAFACSLILGIILYCPFMRQKRRTFILFCAVQNKRG